MKLRDSLIMNYIRRHPDECSKQLAHRFNVSLTTITTIRRHSGVVPYKRRIAQERRVSAKELDKMVLKAVYDKCLVDRVLS